MNNDNLESKDYPKSRGKALFFLLGGIGFILAMAGTATYAYFAASLSTNAAANVNMNKLPAGAGSCAGSGTGTVTATAITAADMQQSNNSTTAKTTATSNNITMTATPPDANTKATCTYNLTWAWTSTGGYTQSASLGSNKELTYTVEKWNGSSWASVVAETQFPTAANTNAANIKTGETTVANGTATTTTYHVILKWYNANLNQSAHVNATYAGKLGFSTPTIALGAKTA